MRLPRLVWVSSKGVQADGGQLHAVGDRITVTSR